MLDDKKSDDMTSKAERKRKSDASPVEFCRRSLAGGNVWDSLAGLLKITKLRGGGADDVKEVWEVVQHLFTNIVKPSLTPARCACWAARSVAGHISSGSTVLRKPKPPALLAPKSHNPCSPVCCVCLRASRHAGTGGNPSAGVCMPCAAEHAQLPACCTPLLRHSLLRALDALESIASFHCM